MSSRFGHDFSRVRVFSDSAADRAAQAFDANAFTVGDSIWFRDGAYAPETTDGQRLLAHELTHVVQQSDASASGQATPVLPFSHRGDDAEREAESVADSVFSTSSVQVEHSAPATIAREERGHHGGGWLDRALGLNPDRTFTEAFLSPVTDLMQTRPGESGLTTAGRTAAMVPGALYGMPAFAWGHLLDFVNNPFHAVGLGE